jgi:ribosomal protein S18 acetylase RimI-like enzyme
VTGSDPGSGSDGGPSSLEARPCSTEDLVQLRATWPLPTDVHDRHFSRQLSGSETFVVAWQDGEAVGSVVIRWQHPELGEVDTTHPGVVEVAHLQVRPDRRRRGVGTCLMEAAERLARLRAVPWLGLGVGVDNPEATALYESLGYMRTGIGTQSEYEYVDESGVAQHASEWDEYMIKNLEVTP